MPTPLQDKSKKGEGGRKENFKQIFSSLSFVIIIIFVCLSIHPITDCVFERECCFWVQTHTARWICHYPPAYILVKVPYLWLLFSTLSLSLSVCQLVTTLQSRVNLKLSFSFSVPNKLFGNCTHPYCAYSILVSFLIVIMCHLCMFHTLELCTLY